MLKTNLPFIFWLFYSLPVIEAQAQIVPDQTLEKESSIVSPVDELNDEIKGGATRGSNLFHSFTEFNVGKGRSVDFVNPNSIDNIITRVTGSNVSNIFGKLGVLGKANLFLINPNGIIFGEGARLDISGSFYGSTAESILFPDNIEFSAINPQAPILTINVPIGLGLGNNPGTIINRSLVQNDTGKLVGLEMTPAANLTLVGGEIKFEGGKVTAPGGRVELGGLSAAGIVTLKENGSLSFPQNIARADITLTNAAEVDVRAEGGGSITVNARNLELSDSSFLRAGIAPYSESPGAKAGDIRLNATDTISVSQTSGIINRVEKKGVGDAGMINVTTANLFLTQGSQIDARTYGQGDAGKITVTASGIISAKGESESVDEQSSGIFNRVERTGVGNAGGITISTANLSLTQGGQFDASTYGQGTGGTISIDATDTILVEGRRPSDRVRSRIVTTIGNSDTALGEGGDINITTANLSLAKGGRINAGTYGRGNAGRIDITATDTIFVEGEYDNLSSTGILSEVGNEGVGDAEGITITTANLVLTRGGVVSVNTIGKGNAGTVKVTASDTISIQDTIMIEERNRQRFNSSRISSTVVNSNREARKGGAIEITTNNLSLTKGGRVNASTNGRGDAGSITIKANDTISVQGESQNKNRRSGIFSQVGSRGVGNGGGIVITTDKLLVTERGRINASTNGQGNGGTITVTANQLTAQNEGELSVRGQEKFNPGNIKVNAGKITLDNQSSIIADAEFGSQGNITLNTDNLLTLRRESIISTNAQGSATGGNITINTNDGFIIALPQENSDITANAFSGSGGTIKINAVGIFGISELSREELIELQETKNPDELDPTQVNSSDITALSQVNSNLNGQINLNTLEIEPSRQLFQLPTQPLNSQIAQACTPGTKEARSEFVLSGRGSIAPHSLEALQINPPRPDWVELSSQSENASQPQLSTSKFVTSTKIVEAQGWVRDENGEVILVADAADVIPHSSWHNPKQCAHN